MAISSEEAARFIGYQNKGKLTSEEALDYSSLVTRVEPAEDIGIMSAAKKGFAQVTLPESATKMEKAAHFVGEAAPPLAGAVAGSVFGPAGSVIGAASGRALQKGVAQTTGMSPVQSGLAIAADVIATGALQKAGDVAAPYAAAGIGKIINVGEWLATRIGRAFLKSAGKVTKYGQDPVQALKTEGITGVSWDDLAQNVDSKLAELGEQYQKAKSLYGENIVDFRKITKPADKVISELKKRGATENAAAIARVEQIKADALPKAIEMPVKDAMRVVKEELAVAKYTGAASDDAIINSVKQQIKAAAKKELHNKVPEYAAIDERYGNLKALETAIDKRAPVAESMDVIGLPEMIGGGAMSAGGEKVISGAIAGSGKIFKTPLGATQLIKILNTDTGLGTAAELLADTPGAASAVSSWLSKTGIDAVTYAKGLQKEHEDHPTFDTPHLLQAVADELKKDPKFYDKGK